MAVVLSLSRQLLARCAPTFKTIRQISRTSALSNVDEELRNTITPTDFQKFVLVWTKAYKTKEDVPNRITVQKMKKAMVKFRVRSMIVIFLLGHVVLYLSISSYRKSRDSGDSLRGTQQELYWREKELERLAREQQQTIEYDKSNQRI